MDKNQSLNETSDPKNLESQTILDSKEIEAKSVPKTAIETDSTVLLDANTLYDYKVSNIYGESKQLELSDYQFDSNDLYIDHSETWILFAKVMGTYSPYPWSEFFLFTALKRGYYNEFGLVQLNSLSSFNFMAGLDFANRSLTLMPFVQRMFNTDKLPAPILKVCRVSRKGFREFQSIMRVLGVLFKVPFGRPKKRKKPYRAIERHLELPILMRTTGPLPWIQCIVIIIIPISLYKAQNSFINYIGTLDIDKILSKHKKVNQYISELTREFKLHYNRRDRFISYGLQKPNKLNQQLSKLILSNHFKLGVNETLYLFLTENSNKNKYTASTIGSNIRDDNYITPSVNIDHSRDSHIDQDKNEYKNGQLHHVLDSDPDNDADNHKVENGKEDSGIEEDNGDKNSGTEKDNELEEDIEEDIEPDLEEDIKENNGDKHFVTEEGNELEEYYKIEEDIEEEYDDDLEEDYDFNFIVQDDDIVEDIGTDLEEDYDYDYDRSNQDVGNGRPIPGPVQPNKEGNGAFTERNLEDKGNGSLTKQNPDDKGNGALTKQNPDDPDDKGNGTLPTDNPDDKGNGALNRLQTVGLNNLKEFNSVIFNDYLDPYKYNELPFYKGFYDIYKLHQNEQYEQIKSYFRLYDLSDQILLNHINQNIAFSQHLKQVINRSIQNVSINDYKQHNSSIYNFGSWYDIAIKWEREQKIDRIAFIAKRDNFYVMCLQVFNQFGNLYQKILFYLIKKATPIVGIQTINNIQSLQYTFIRTIYLVYNNINYYIINIWENISYIHITSNYYIASILTKLRILSSRACDVFPANIIYQYIHNSEHISAVFLLFKNQVKVNPSIKQQITDWDKSYTIEPLPINLDYNNQKDDESINSSDSSKSSKEDINVEYNIENQPSEYQNNIKKEELSVLSGEEFCNEITNQQTPNSSHKSTSEFDHSFHADLKSDIQRICTDPNKCRKNTEFYNKDGAEENLQDETIRACYETQKDQLIDWTKTEDEVSLNKDIFEKSHVGIEEIVQVFDDFQFEPMEQLDNETLNNDIESSQVTQEQAEEDNNIAHDEYPEDNTENNQYPEDSHTEYRSRTNISRVINIHNNILQLNNNNISAQNKLSKKSKFIALLKANNIYDQLLEQCLNWFYNNLQRNQNEIVSIDGNQNFSSDTVYDLSSVTSIDSVNSLLSTYTHKNNRSILMLDHLLSRLSYSRQLLYSLLVDKQKEYKTLLTTKKKHDVKAIYILVNNWLLNEKQTSISFLDFKNNIHHFGELFEIYTPNVLSTSNNFSTRSNSNITFGYNYHDILLSEIAFLDVNKQFDFIRKKLYNKKVVDNNFLLTSYEIQKNKNTLTKFGLDQELILQNIDETVHISGSSSVFDFYGNIILTPQGYSKISGFINKIKSIVKKFIESNLTFLESTNQNRQKHFVNLIQDIYHDLNIQFVLENENVKYIQNSLQDIQNSVNEFVFKDIYNELKINRLFPNLVIKQNYSLAILGLSAIVFISVAGSASIVFFFYWTWRKVEDCINIDFPTRYTESKILIDHSILGKFREISVKPILLPTGGPIIDTYNLIYYMYMYKKIVPKRLMDTKSGDLLRLERSIAEKSLITNRALLKSNTNLKQKIGRSDYYGSLINDYELNTLQAYVTTYRSTPIYLLKHRLVSCNYKYIYYALYSSVKSHKLPESVVLNNLKPPVNLNVKYKRPWSLFPISFETFPCRGYLIIGHQNAGKTYLTKSLAANTNLSLVYISIEKIFAIKLDLQAEINFNSDSGMRPLLDHRKSELSSRKYERLIKMQILFRLAEKISPCIVWIPSLERYTTNFFRNDATLGIAGLSLMMIVKTMEKTLNRDVNPKIMFVGGCENTRELDPILLHPQRFDTLVRLENPTPPEREISVLSLLHTEGIEVSSDFQFETVQNATMGYTMRHIGSLVDNILRTCKNLDSSVIDTVLMNEVVQRQQVEWDITYEAERKYIASYEFVAYKVGKALVKKQILPQPLFHSRSFWQIKFYYLSKWFLENRPEDSTITEILMLPYFYSSLAGIAARDAWIMISLGRLSEHIVASEILEDDIDIALNLFRAYHSELGFLSLNNKNSILLGNQMIFSPDVYWKTGRLLSILGQFDINTAHHEPSNISIEIEYDRRLFKDYDINKFIRSIIHWSPYFCRMPMYRSFLLDVEKHVNQVPSIYSIVRYGTAEQLSQTFRTRLTDEEYWRLPEQHFYRMDNIEPSFSELLVDHAAERKIFMERRTDEMEWMVDSQHDTVDRTEYYNPYESIFAISGKCIWDPKPVNPRHLEFRNRDLIANRLVMSTLYSVYEDKVTPYINPFLLIKKPFWFRDEAKEKQEALIQEKLDAAREENTYIKEFLAERKKLLMEIENFHTHKLIARINSTLLRPKCYTKIEGTFDVIIGKNPLEGLERYNVLFDENLYQATKGIQLEIFIHKHLLDTYNALYKWFIKNHSMFAKLTDILYTKGVLWPEQIEKFGIKNGLAYLEQIDAPVLPYAKYLQDQRINLRIWYNLSMRYLLRMH